MLLGKQDRKKKGSNIASFHQDRMLPPSFYFGINSLPPAAPHRF